MSRRNRILALAVLSALVLLSMIAPVHAAVRRCADAAQRDRQPWRHNV